MSSLTVINIPHKLNLYPERNSCNIFSLCCIPHGIVRVLGGCALCSYIRTVMNFKGLGYDLKPISLDGEQHDKEFLEINPLGFVPALKLHDRVLIDSYNIMMYLEENRIGYKLIPEDMNDKIKVREIVLLIISSIQPLQNTGVLKKVDDYIKWPQYWITKGFKALETILSKTAGKYCVGDKITMADVCLVPQVFNARKYNVDLNDYPIIVRIDKELENHPAFCTTHPYKQPDYPGNKSNN